MVRLVGVTFDRSPLDFYFQLLDPRLLEESLISSVWNLTAQPPLFNLAVGAVLQLPNGAEAGSFALVFAALGWALAWASATLLVEAGIRGWVAVLVALLLVTSPAVIVFENWLFYTLPVAAGLAVGFVMLLRWFRGAGIAYGLAAFSAFSAVALTRTTYHFAWLVGLLALSVLPWRSRPRGWALAVIPVALVAAWYLRPVGPFVSLGGWPGMNLALGTFEAMSPADARDLVDDGTVSAAALTRPFSYPDQYPEQFAEQERTGVPARDEPFRSTGYPNFNADAYREVDSQYFEDSLAAIRARPEILLSIAKASALQGTKPAQDALGVEGNRDRLEPYPRISRWLELPVPAGPLRDVSLLILALYGVALTFAAHQALHLARGDAEDRAAARVVVAAGGTIAWVLIASIFVGGAEHNRFRFEVDPVALVLALTAWSAMRSRWSGQPAV